MHISDIIANLQIREQKGVDRAIPALQMALLRAALHSLEAFDEAGGDGQTNGQGEG